MSSHDLAHAMRCIRADTSRPAGDALSRVLDDARTGGLASAAGVPAKAFVPPAPSRDRLWELSSNLHCSIIGTCLTTADLRALLAKLGEPGARTMSEHALHSHAVTLAGRREGGGKLLHKLLDRRHEREIARLDRAMDAAEKGGEGTGVDGVRAYWRKAMERGEVPGAYWAVITHPLTDHALVQEVFGEVHMLSHLVGRAVRADLRRLAGLEEALAARDEVVAELEARVCALTADKVALAERLAAAERDAMPSPVRPEPDVEGALAQWRERLDRAEAHARAEAERRAALEGAATGLAEEVRLAGEREATLRAERDGLEVALGEHLDGVGAADEGPEELGGLTTLYVGGRPRGVAQARRLVERRGGTLLSHDGGVEEAVGLLPGLVARADLVLFPVDCVSHDAALGLKRLCRDGGPPLVPLRSASLAALVAALATAGTLAGQPAGRSRPAGNVRPHAGGSP